MLRLDSILRYLAGFADADGCFSVAIRHKDRAQPWFVPSVSIGNTNVTVLDMFARLFGGKVYVTKPVMGRKQVYHWQVSARMARITAAALVPYLVMKKQQAEIIRDWPVSGNGPRSDALFGAQIRLYHESHILNKTGRLTRTAR